MKPPKRKFSRQPKRRPQPPGTSWEPMPTDQGNTHQPTPTPKNKVMR